MALKETIEARVAALDGQLPQVRYDTLQLYQDWIVAKSLENQLTNERESLLEILKDMEQPTA